jgi:hypothetical protein
VVIDIAGVSLRKRTENDAVRLRDLRGAGKGRRGPTPSMKLRLLGAPIAQDVITVNDFSARKGNG